MRGAEATVLAAKGHVGRYCIHAAAFSGHILILEYLLSRGAEVGVQDEEGTTPLHVAARGGFLTLVEHLLGWGAEARARNQDGDLPFNFALMGDHDSLAQYLGQQARQGGEL